MSQVVVGALPTGVSFSDGAAVVSPDHDQLLPALDELPLWL